MNRQSDYTYLIATVTGSLMLHSNQWERRGGRIEEKVEDEKDGSCHRVSWDIYFRQILSSACNCVSKCYQACKTKRINGRESAASLILRLFTLLCKPY